jgi:RNA polymerase sigma-70 factor (ECF subfamily)
MKVSYRLTIRASDEVGLRKRGFSSRQFQQASEQVTSDVPRDDKSAAWLVERILAGDSGAEDELVARYSRGVSRMIRANGGQLAVEDLRQKTFELALQKIRQGELRDPEKLSSFILGVARFVALGHIRRLRSGKETGLEAAELVVDPAPDPLDQLLQKETAQLIWQAINQLKSPRDREILSRLIAEEDQRQVGADLGLTNLQFNVVLFRARERFKKLYLKLIR